jgi:hypothetical protein
VPDPNNPEISVTLPLSMWNLCFDCLGDQPFKKVADLIVAIRSQAQQQAQAVSMTRPQSPANGELRDAA